MNKFVKLIIVISNYLMEVVINANPILLLFTQKILIRLVIPMMTWMVIVV